MLTLNLYHNYNGKLFADHFSHLQVYSPEFFIGVEVNVIYRPNQSTVHMGIARIETLRQFRFDRLSDVVSYLNMGKPAVYQAAQLNKIYNNGKTLPGDTIIMHLVLGYIQRNIENHSRLIAEWQEAKKQTNEHSI